MSAARKFSASGNKPDLAALKIDDGHRGADRPKPWWVWSIGAALVLAGGVFWVTLGVKRDLRVRVAVVNAPVSDRGVVSLTASGYVTARRQATVSAELTARVEEVLVDEGTVVKSGQVLATLDVSEARSQLLVHRSARNGALALTEAREVALANAERKLVRLHELAARNLASSSVVEDGQTQVDELKSQVSLARSQREEAEARAHATQTLINKGTVRAPFAGVVVSKDANEGEMVSPMSAGGSFTRTGIATIVDMSSLELEVDVNESYIARVVEGMQAEATLDAYPEWKIPARVRTVIPTADRQRATVKVRIAFLELDPRILPNMGAKVSFLKNDQPETQTPRALVPKAAVHTDATVQWVFVVRNAVVERRAIKADMRIDGDMAPVLAGLSVGESVVIEGPSGLSEGDRVVVKQ